VDSIYEAWQGTDGNGGLKQEIAETLERVENTRDEIVQEWEGTENSEGLKQQLEDMLNGIVIEDNLTSTSTTSSLSAHQGKVLNDTKADKQTANGGFAGGAGAFAEHGGSVGMETKTGDGFAGGYQAKTVDANNNAIDAIQLGAGMNSTEKTLQVYDKQLLDAEGHIPDERMPQLADKQTEWIITTAGTGAAYTATLDPAPESLYIGMQITIIPHVSSSSSSATLNVNGTGAKYFRQRGRTTGTLYSPSVYSFLAAGKPTTLIYDGTYWVMTEYSRPNWNDIKDKPEAILSAENIIAGDNVTVTTNGNDVTISASGGGSDVNVVDNLTSTSTTSALSANQGKILDEKKANRQTEHGGFAGGEQSNAGDGGAIGLGADSSGGFAGGAVSSTSNGGAIGMEAKTGDGFAGGMYAKTMNAQGNGIDAIQLGTGTNTAPKTLQVYEYQLLDQNGKIPTERLLNAAGGYEVGDMLTTLRTDLDDSWLLCNGASISKTSYPELAQICPPELTRKWRYEYTSSFVSMNSEYAVANGYFVVLTNDKKIHYATNPTTNNWKTITLSISFTPNRIDYINGYWIVSGGGMNIAYTRDLNSTWTSVTAITTDHKNSSEIFTNIEYGDGYYAFGYNYIDTGYTYPAIAYSTTLNATSWNSTAIGSSVNASRGLAKLLYDPNRKRWLGLKNGVVVGRESITNGTFGTSSTPSANDVVNNVVFLNNKIVMLYNEKIRYMDSSNNIVVTPDATLTTNYSSITYGNGYWILPSGSNNEGNNYMLSSTDLEHWTRTPQQNIYVGEVLYTNGYFVGMQYAPSSGGTYGYIATNFNDKVLPAVYNDAGYTYIKAK
ncbi:MAG: hypothetical protein HFI90_07120, partial [Clostridia bacterium]|nr:hypothetical protein [Clostridia bacterium]